MTLEIAKVSILGKEAIHVGLDLFRWIPTDLTASLPKVSKFVCVTDTIVAGLWLPSLQAAFKAASPAGIDLEAFVIPPGEPAKIRSTKDAIEDWMLARKCGRDTCLIALGGGVVGDLVGFVASTFMRGIPVVQIPTTLLAMVDSSIGGKTGLDTPSGKNLIGAFHQPHRVYLDTSLLASLPDRHLSNGMAEVIKTAAFWSSEFFDWLEGNVDLVLARHPPSIQHLVLECVKVKAYVVTEDEKETSGLRSILNFGHTIGHAIEALCQPEMLHGEAVSLGMIKEAELARSLGLLSQANIARLADCLDAYNLPTKYPYNRLTVEQMMQKMSVDKKNESGNKSVLLLKSIGAHVTLPGNGNKPIGASRVADADIRRVLSTHVSVAHRPSPVAAAQPKRVSVPGSKSVSNRVLLMAGLGRGVCKISGLLHSDDTRVMLQALKDLGVPHVAHESDGNVVSITGSEGLLRAPDAEVYLGNAGTAARFLTTAATLVKAGKASAVTLTGNARMKERPNGPLIAALTENGAQIECLSKPGCLPIRVASGAGLAGGEMKLAANISSQYVSSILISAPYAETPVSLSLVGGEVVSQPYIDMTLALMKDFGVVADKPPADAWAPKYAIPKAVYVNPQEYLVEGDASSATYPLAIAAITGDSVTVENVGSQSLQGDAQFCKLLASMGCGVEQTPTSTTVTGPSRQTGQRLRALGQVDMSDMTDAFMTLAVLAAVAEGTTRIVNIANQRVKECNRILVMVQELSKMGVQANELEDGIEIVGASPATLRGAHIECHDDHRIAMSFAVLGCVVPGVVITEKACVEKTYPEFWDDISLKLGVSVDAVSAEHREAVAAGSHVLSSSPSVVVIGMRGAGKSTLGAAVAKLTRRRFIDLDAYIEEKHLSGSKIIKFVESNGWPAFREVEFTALSELLSLPSFRASASGQSGALAATAGEPILLACGGGIVETEKARALLSAHPLVIQLSRSIDAIVAYLESDATRPRFAEHPRDVFARRLPLYRACSKYEFVIREKDADWAKITEEFARFVRFVSGDQRLLALPNKLLSSHDLAHPSGWLFPVEHLDTPTFFLSLTFPSLAAESVGSKFRPTLEKYLSGNHPASLPPSSLIVDRILSADDIGDDSIVGPRLLSGICESGVHAIELRVDLLACHRDLEAVAQEVAILRRLAPLNVPVIFTVRSQAQGGSFTGTEQEMFALLRLGVRLGCEYIDMESCWSEASRESFLRLCESTHSRAIGSYHVPVGWGQSAVPAADQAEAATLSATHLTSLLPLGLSGKSPVPDADWNALRGRFDECSHGGRVQLIKVIARAGTVEDCFALSTLSKSLHYSSTSPKEFGRPIPVLTLCMGEAGSLSRGLNMAMTPVTHPLLPAKAAPGQLSVTQIHQLRHLCGLLPARQFVLLGTPIKLSMSPTLHNTAFHAVGLPHNYSLCETDQVEFALKVLRSEQSPPQQLLSFAGAPVRGASVTIPLKEAIMPHLDSLTPAARLIGAVNTVVVVDAAQGRATALHGDNTDWLGIARCISAKTDWPIDDSFCTAKRFTAGDGEPRWGLVIGAGGTARAAVYALLALGVSGVAILNRTAEKAAAIASNYAPYGRMVATRSVDQEWMAAQGIPYFSAVVSTVPATAGVTLPEHVFARSPGQPPLVLLDAAYIPSATELTRQAAQFKCQVVFGYEMLIEQGVAQFEIWTGLPCPAQAVRHAVVTRYFEMTKSL